MKSGWRTATEAERPFRWETSDSAVATVEGSFQAPDHNYDYEAGPTATVTAVDEGTVTITASWVDLTTSVTGATTALRGARSTVGGGTLTHRVNVTVAARAAPGGARMEVSPTELNFTALGETQTVSIRIYDENGDKIEDPRVFITAVVDLLWPDEGTFNSLLDGQDAEPGAIAEWRLVPGGLEVTAYGHGSGNISIIDNETGQPPFIGGVTAQVVDVSIFVTQVPTTFTVTPDSLNLVAGEIATLQATMTDANGYEIYMADAEHGGTMVTWETSDSAVATLEGPLDWLDNGQASGRAYGANASVTAVAAGSATITARNAWNMTTSVSVTGTIADNAAPQTREVSISAANDTTNTTTRSVTAQSNSVTEGTAAVFTLTRTGSLADALTVNVGVTETGAMLNGAPPATVTFDADSATAELRVETDDDEVDESASVITAELAAGSGYSMDAGAVLGHGDGGGR